MPTNLNSKDRQPRRFLLKSYAKINLSLLVYAPRQRDRYHPICSVFQNISLHDTITVTLKPKGAFTLRSSDASIPEKENLITKIHTALAPRLPFGLDITLEKNIPLGAGLGGGSSNAGAFLGFLNKVGALNLSANKLRGIATSVGADVPFFLDGGTSLVRGIGDRLTALKPLENKKYIIIHPGLSVATPLVYKTFDAITPTPLKPGRTPAWIYRDQIGPNHLESATFSLYPELKNIKERLLSCGAPEVRMSGSGSALFIPFDASVNTTPVLAAIQKEFPLFFIKEATRTNRGFDITEITEAFIS